MNDHRDDHRDHRRGALRVAPGPILVTRPAGNVGRHVAALLAERGVPLRLLAHRTPPPAPPGAEVVHGDLADPATLRPALAGVRAVFLQWPLPDASGAREAVRTVAEHAPLAVYLSSAGIDDAADGQSDPVNRRHAAVERELARSGVAWTAVRAGGLAASLLGWAPEIRERGTVRDAFPTASRALLDERDVAEVAVRALTEPGHTGERYILSGPEPLTTEEQVRIIGRAIGRDVHLETPSRGEVLAEMAAEGWARTAAEQMLDAYARMSERPGAVTDTVERITGSPARPLLDWARYHVDDFR